MSTDHRLTAALGALPLFPLPGTVFFPHTLLPLHVFEARYRQLTEHVLEGHGHLGVVCLDESRTDAPVPNVAAVAGVGRIVHHERLPDGRFHLLLQGVARAELSAELPAQGLMYRRVVARALGADEESGASDELDALRTCYERLLHCCPDLAHVLGDLPLRVCEPCVLADVACATLLQDIGERQRALEERSVVRRLRCAHDALAALALREWPPDPDALN
jgi:Lon protease-like protein